MRAVAVGHDRVGRDAAAAERDAFRRDVFAGLSAPARRLPSRWFYDERGSALFRRICELPEYYLTRAEEEIFREQADRIVSPLSGAPWTVVDLGAGDGQKTRLLLGALARDGSLAAYAPVDVSPAALAQAAAGVAAGLPGVRVDPVRAEYRQAVRWLSALPSRGPLLVLWLGSNIGNLEPPQALRFLRALRSALSPGDHVLVGFDLAKDPEVLRRAYDDAAGVTAAFNLNLLARINRELDGDFDLAAFGHLATFDPVRPAMESWLVSRRRQVARVAGRDFAFRAWERIHTEISCKFRPGDLAALGERAGLEEVKRFTDRAGAFADVLWRVPAGRERP